MKAGNMQLLRALKLQKIGKAERLPLPKRNMSYKALLRRTPTKTREGQYRENIQETFTV